MGDAMASPYEMYASDINIDDIINIVDVVTIVNIILDP